MSVTLAHQEKLPAIDSSQPESAEPSIMMTKFIRSIGGNLKSNQIEAVKQVVTQPFFEGESNEMLRMVGLQMQATALILVAKFVPDEHEFIYKDPDLFLLMGKVIHTCLGLRVPKTAPTSMRLRVLTDNQISKLILLIYHDLLPLVEDRNFQGVGNTLLEIIPYYPLPKMDDPDYQARLTEAIRRAIIKGACNEATHWQLERYKVIGMDKERANAAFDAIINDLHSSRGELEPTKQELMLNAIRNSPGLEFLLEDIEHIFSGSDTDAKRLAQKKLSEINEKLQDYGFQIERTQGYRVTEKKSS